MHAGYPMLDELRALLFAHPQVYVDIGSIVYTEPRPAFYRFLQGIVDAGYGERVMFGSDQMVWPGIIEPSIKVIEDATFLDAKQKRDILYRSEEHTSELQSLMRISYAGFCLKQKKNTL